MFLKRANDLDFLSAVVGGVASLGLAFALSGCAGAVRDEAAMASVKRVAIVGFSAYEPVTASLGGGASAGGMMDQGSLEELVDPTVDQMLEQMNAAFTKKMNWTMMSESSIKKNPAFDAAYKKTMKGFQNKMPPGKGRIQYVAKDMLDYDSGRILREKGREELMEKLGVDAIVVAKVDVILGGTTVMGVGARHPQSIVSYDVFAKGKPNAIWTEHNLKGVETESVGKTAFIDEDLLHKYAMKSAFTAFEKIGEKPAK